MIKGKHIVVPKNKFETMLKIADWTAIDQKEVRVWHCLNLIVLLHESYSVYEFLVICWEHINFLKWTFVPPSKNDQLLCISQWIFSNDGAKIDTTILHLNI